MSRESRYKDFDEFSNSADKHFNNLNKTDERFKEISEVYSFNIAKGGATGGLDKRIIEIFFGKRPIDKVQILEQVEEGQFPQQRETLVVEKGAMLRYQRTDIGNAICTIFPAKTKDLSQREDFIILGFINKPKSLKSKRKLGKHWRAFMSYMECTSVDGSPNLVDKLRVAYLRFTRISVSNGKANERRIFTAIKTIMVYTLTIGLSGFLLALINTFNDVGETKQIKNEIYEVSHKLSKAYGVIYAQNQRIASLEKRIDTTQSSRDRVYNAIINRVLFDINQGRCLPQALVNFLCFQSTDFSKPNNQLDQANPKEK
ncbi:MAG: hypothetical protein ABTR07_12640 [Candidatus Competibacter denitrificans]